MINVETRVVDDEMRDVAPRRDRRDRAPLAATPERLLPRRRAHAAAFAGGWFHSGDLATVDAEGYITIVDRKKDMIKTGGENVASREVEEAIYRLPGVSEVAVIGLPHARWVEAVTAVVVAKPGVAVTEQQVIAHCSELPGALQGAQRRRVRREPAEEPERQAAEARTAPPVRSALHTLKFTGVPSR